MRPLGPLFPNWQISYSLIYGRGNTDERDARHEHHGLMASVEHPYFVATGQFIRGQGIASAPSDEWLDWTKQTKTYQGASAFLELKLPWILSSVIGRYDWFDGPNPSGDTPYHRILTGYAFHFYGRNKNLLLLDFDYSIFEELRNRWVVNLFMQIKL